MVVKIQSGYFLTTILTLQNYKVNAMERYIDKQESVYLCMFVCMYIYIYIYIYI